MKTRCIKLLLNTSKIDWLSKRYMTPKGSHVGEQSFTFPWRRIIVQSLPEKRGVLKNIATLNFEMKKLTQIELATTEFAHVFFQRDGGSVLKGIDQSW